jgi:hypothetical protein
VRITDAESTPLPSVYLALSDSEATELIDALTELRAADKSWHVHVGDATYQHEITVYREDDETAADFVKPS